MENNKRKIFLLSLTVLGVLVFQILYYQLTLVIMNPIIKLIGPIPNGYILMIHHFIQFILLFIPTIIINYKLHIDFGYHIKEWKKGLPFLAAGIIFAIIISLIMALQGYYSEFKIDDLLFQLFFSGLGEEIVYRSIPLVLFTLAYQGETVIKIKNKYSFDFGIVISATMFSIAHISFQFGYSYISFSLTQLICAFIMGIILGITYKKTNSVFFCMLVHGVYNALTVLLLLIPANL